jgi:hypothetical protein
MIRNELVRSPVTAEAVQEEISYSFPTLSDFGEHLQRAQYFRGEKLFEDKNSSGD